MFSHLFRLQLINLRYTFKRYDFSSFLFSDYTHSKDIYKPGFLVSIFLHHPRSPVLGWSKCSFSPSGSSASVQHLFLSHRIGGMTQHVSCESPDTYSVAAAKPTGSAWHSCKPGRMQRENEYTFIAFRQKHIHRWICLTKQSYWTVYL